MIVNSGFRGASRIGTPPNMRRLRIQGFGAVFGDTPTTGWSDQSYGPTYAPDLLQTSGTSGTTDIGTTAAGIGTGIGSILTGIGSLFASTQSNPSTGPVYSPSASQAGSSMSPAMLAGIAVVGVGAVLLLTRKK